MFSKYSCLFVFSVFVFSESAFVDTLNKCQRNDHECGKKLLQKIMKDIAKTGIPEIGIPPIDPIHLKNTTVKVLDLMEFTLIEGTAKGIEKCIYNKFELNTEENRAFVDLTCDIVVKGKYKLFSSSPLLKNLLNGDSVRGNGNGKVSIEKVNLKLYFFYDTETRNGDTYVKFDSNKTKYDFDVKGNMKFSADNIYVGEQESSNFVVGLLNQNWRMLMTSFGKPFMDKAMTYVLEFMEKFYSGIPTKYFIASS